MTTRTVDVSERLALAMPDSDLAIVLLAFGVHHRLSRALMAHGNHLRDNGHRDLARADSSYIEAHWGMDLLQLFP